MAQVSMTNTNDKTQIETKSMSLPRMMLSVEGLTVFISSIAAYWFVGANWWMFLILLLSPDLVFIIYMMDKRIGTIAYNIMHTYTLPVAMMMVSLFAGWQLGITLAIIWFAHIGMDRTVGYGLKYQSDFKDTHLQRA